MLFTDDAFLFRFLPIVLLGLRLVGSTPGLPLGTAARAWIIVATLVFYGRAHPWYLLPLAVTIAFDFFWARAISSSDSLRARRFFVAASVVQNLSMLAYFKYHAAQLPPGISFYTFESMSFVIDVYRGVVAFPKRPSDFFGFLLMFPRFLAGPIVRYREMVTQLDAWPGPRWGAGLSVFFVGFFLKTALADSCAELVPLAFDRPLFASSLAAWIGTYAFFLQIYLDFSGYSLMAIGLGRCLGFEFPPNFDRPYVARSLQDFWRRWHMTLSRWLRDYLYLPLGGSRHGRLRTYANILVTMILGGMWHGGSFTFVAWGAWHGGWLVVDRAAGERVPAWARACLVLPVVFLGWVLFRATTLGEAWEIYRLLFGLSTAPATAPLGFAISNTVWVAFGFSTLYVFFLETRLARLGIFDTITVTWRQAVFAAMGLALGFELSSSFLARPFLYFRF